MAYDNPLLHLYAWVCVALSAVGAVAVDAWWSYGIVGVVALATAWFTWDVFAKK